MEAKSKPFRLPEEFTRRYVASRVLILFPAMATLLVLVAIVKPAVFLPIFLAEVGFLALSVWLYFRSSARSREEIEAYAPYLGAEVVSDTLKSHLIPLTGAVIVLGVCHSISRKDWRWMVVICGIGCLIGAGLYIRWVLYDRWLHRILSGVERIEDF